MSDYYTLRGIIADLPEDFRLRVKAREDELNNMLALDKEGTQMAIALVGLKLQLEDQK